MREIKFRGKGKDIEEWIYGYYWKQRDDKHWIRPVEAIGSFSIQVIPETVGQYTGLKDKNEKEIYEGDIIKSPVWKWTNKIIKFQEGSFIIANSKGSNYKPSRVLNRHKIRHENIEIIGNIYENPELIRRNNG